MSTSTLSHIWQQRELLQSLARRDIAARYKGSSLGLLWAVITPLLLLAVYTAVFSGIFQARWGQTGGPLEYALQLFVGLTVHGLASECINRSPALMLNNVSYVKRVVFPLHLLPVVTVISALFHFILSLIILVLFAMLALQQLPLLGLLYTPFIVLPYLLWLLGISFLLSGLGVYFRDINQVMGLVTTLLLFLSPVFYPAAMLPKHLQGLFMLNPLTVIIEQLRAVLLDGGAPDWGVLSLYSIGALAMLAVGLWAFKKMRGGFADVL